LLNIKKGQGNNEDGEIDGASNDNIFATYFHGIFHNYNFRREFLNYIRVKKGLEAKYGDDPYSTQKDYSLNRLAEIVEENLDMDIIDKLLFS
jgi:adenosylcobyric acid synthase